MLEIFSCAYRFSTFLRAHQGYFIFTVGGAQYILDIQVNTVYRVRVARAHLPRYTFKDKHAQDTRSMITSIVYRVPIVFCGHLADISNSLSVLATS